MAAPEILTFQWCWSLVNLIKKALITKRNRVRPNLSNSPWEKTKHYYLPSTKHINGDNIFILNSRLVFSRFFDFHGNLPVHWLKKSDYSSLIELMNFPRECLWCGDFRIFTLYPFFGSIFSLNRWNTFFCSFVTFFTLFTFEVKFLILNWIRNSIE